MNYYKLSLVFFFLNLGLSFGLFESEGGTFDYIVVGAGTSGCVLANRLTEDGTRTVLLLEGGRQAHSILGGTEFAMMHGQTDPETGLFVPGRPLTVYDVPLLARTSGTIKTDRWDTVHGVAPKVVGGGMAMGIGLWVRATPEQINNWRVAGWNYDDLLHYYKKSENVSGTHVAGDTTYHGTSGPVKLSEPAIIDDEFKIFVNTCISANIPFNNDFDGQSREGCGYLLHNVKDGLRETTATAYLLPALSRRNLHLRIQATVTRILFNHAKTHAIGVEYVRDGVTFRARARKEVVIAGGALKTPHLLMVSGIGPQDQLDEFDIQPVSVLENVGKGITNHFVVPIILENPKASYPNIYGLYDYVNKYATQGTGFLATSGRAGAGSFKTIPTLTEPDIFVSVTTDRSVAYFPKAIAAFGIITANTAYNNGSVTLRSADPLVSGEFHENQGESQEDVDTVVRAIRFLRNLFSHPPASTHFGVELSPGPAAQTDQQLAAYVRSRVVKPSGDQYFGSCRMGNATDPDAVVDQRLRVKGVQRLRVVDASVIPGTSAHAVPTVIAVAEKGAAMILEDNPFTDEDELFDL